MNICDDPYHCNCFKIQTTHTVYMHEQLLNNQFFDPPQENHGQVFGLAKNLDQVMQIHVKVMPTGNIEAEIEPSIRYVEHLNQNYSTPAHYHVKQILDVLRIPYETICASRKCLEGRIHKPTKTTSVLAVLIGGLMILGLIAALVSKK